MGIRSVLFYVVSRYVNLSLISERMSYINIEEYTGWTASCGCTNESMCVQCEIKHQKRQREKMENLLYQISFMQSMSIPIFLFGFGLIGVADLIGGIYPLFIMLAGIAVV